MGGKKEIRSQKKRKDLQHWHMLIQLAMFLPNNVCNVPKMISKKRLHLLTHLRKEHELKVKVCKLCNFIFIQKDFKKHICSGKPCEKDAATGMTTTTKISE